MNEILDKDMNGILDKSIEELTNSSYRCECGQVHEVALQKLILEEGALGRVHEVIQELKLGEKALLIADERTFQAAGEQLFKELRGKGIQVKLSVNYEENLYADEKALGKALIDMEAGTDFIIAVGTGTINDIARFLSYKLRIPYLIVATAPSMDGYASTGSPIIVNGFKKTYIAVSPVAIIGDLRIIGQAPKEMIAAGLGDMLAKITALSDWLLAAAVEEEHHCPIISQMMVKALTYCVEHVQGMKSRNAQSISFLMQGLILSGIAMQMLGNSRPASGSEHHMSHYWEMLHFAEGHGTELHGIKVSVATLLILSMYDKLLQEDLHSLRMLEKTPKQIAQWEQEIRRCYGPLAQEIIESNGKLHLCQADLDQRYERLVGRWDELKEEIASLLQLAPNVKYLLQELDAPVTPGEIGIDKGTTLDALRYAKEVRNRYTILQLTDQLGVLEQYSEALAARDEQRIESVYWQAHRGGGAYEAPDNTMAANKYTWALGGIPEADIRTTQDGVIVCLHDKTLARTTTAPDSVGNKAIFELTFAEIRQWDAGVKFDPKFKGERIPSLEEVFIEMQGHPERLMYLDLKEVDLQQLGKMIDQYGVNTQVIFTHHVQENCMQMKTIAPGVRTMLWIGGNETKIKQKFQSALDTGFQGLDQVQLHLNGKDDSAAWPYEIDSDYLRYALKKTKEAGVDLEVLPFHLNNRTIGALLDMGIRWYATDEPGKFLQSIGRSSEGSRNV